ncbi:MAG: tRNA (adenosine(37)-N6)-dimethylallyltransferase MiaA [Alphaproteobacteria bacterium]|nr:tRNA (adenosine(37)-N6)-dimethylallyltransferase MiaA [Alphaproteobacteria bacterium]
MKNVRVIAGPTASGKSGFALAEAQQHNGVIINADSLQLYEDLPILTARPTAEEEALVPHRLYGFLGPEENMNAQSWAEAAMAEINGALAAGNTPYLVGGTGFYLKTLFEGLSPIPAIPDEVRSEVTTLYEKNGLSWCYEELERVDPRRAEMLAPPDKQRILRSLEVFYATGKPFSHFTSLPKERLYQGLHFDVTIIAPSVEILYANCDKRFLHMIDIGGWDEATELYGRIMNGEISLEAPITRALGYEEIHLCLEGILSQEGAISRAQQKTRNYAKRQNTWLRNQMKSCENISVTLK